MCAMKWKNIDFGLGTLAIENSIAELAPGRLAPETLVLKDTKTHANRRIALDDETLEVLKEQLAVVQERASVACIPVDEDSFVFSRDINGLIPWRPQRVSMRFKQIRDEARLPTHLHGLRHFAGTQLIEAGVSVRTVAERLGHANPSTTLGVYSHWISASDQAAAVALGKLVRRPSDHKALTGKQASTKNDSKSTVKKAGDATSKDLSDKKPIRRDSAR